MMRLLNMNPLMGKTNFIDGSIMHAFTMYRGGVGWNSLGWGVGSEECAQELNGVITWAPQRISTHSSTTAFTDVS